MSTEPAPMPAPPPDPLDALLDRTAGITFTATYEVPDLGIAFRASQIGTVVDIDQSVDNGPWNRRGYATWTPEGLVPRIARGMEDVSRALGARLFEKLCTARAARLEALLAAYRDLCTAAVTTGDEVARQRARFRRTEVENAILTHQEQVNPLPAPRRADPPLGVFPGEG